jgi:hypothetical protein
MKIQAMGETQHRSISDIAVAKAGRGILLVQSEGKHGKKTASANDGQLDLVSRFL